MVDEQPGAALTRHDPKRTGPYLLLRRLGSGGFGTVYLARREDSARWVAVKVIHAHLLATDPQFRDRFAREVSYARLVTGPYTAQVLDADPGAETPWMASEYVVGATLSGKVSTHGPLPVRAVLSLAAGISEALEAIHRAGLVHRDLKPANVVLAGDGPKVIDFGIAQHTGSTKITPAGAVLGTVPYLAPEQLEPDALLSPALDVHALGAVLCFAATGRPPYRGDSFPVLAGRIATGKHDLNGLDDPELRDLVRACLATSPEDRPTLDYVRKGCLDLLAASHEQPPLPSSTGLAPAQTTLVVGRPPLTLINEDATPQTKGHTTSPAPLSTGEPPDPPAAGPATDPQPDGSAARGRAPAPGDGHPLPVRMV